MATVTWDGETSTDWFNATNWSGNVVPSLFDDVIINNGSLGFQPTLNFGSSSVGSVTISGGTLTLTNDGTLSSPNITLTATGSMAIGFDCVVFGDVAMGSSSVLTNNGAIIGNLSVTNGTVNNNSDLSGDVTVNGGALNLNAGTNITDSFSVAVSGTGMLSVNAAETVATVTHSGGTIQGGGILTTTTYTQSGGTMDGILSASGTKTLNGGEISGVLQGAGATIIQTGTTTVSGTITGNVTVASSGTLRIDGSTAVSGTITAEGSRISYAELAEENSAIVLTAAGTDFEVFGGDEATQSGIISESAGGMGLNKTGTGTLTLTGANTYGGVTHVIGGTLVAGHADALSDLLRVTNAGSELDLGSNSVTAFSVIVQNGTISNGTLTVTANSPLATQLGDGGTISASVAGIGGITVEGAGTSTLSGNNTYTGQTIVNAVLGITSDTALGSTLAGTIVNSGGVLQLSGGITVAEAITLNGNGVANGGALRSVSGLNVVSGAITLGSATRINTDADQMELVGGVTGTDTDLTVGGAGVIIIDSAIATGAGTLTKDGTGTLTLSGINTFTGSTTVNAGFLQLDNGSALADSGALIVNTGATVQLFAGETVGALSGSGTIFLQTANALVVGDGTNTEFSGAISEIGAVGAFTKAGSGTLTLSGTNTYTGTTTVSAGTLALSGTGSISNSIVIALVTGTTFDISGTTTGATIVDLYATSGAANVIMGGRSLTMSGVAGGFGQLTFTGGTGVDALSIAIISTLTDFSLAGVAFANWTTNVDTINLTGNSLDNALTGSAQHDSINGGDGADTINGGDGNDVLNGGVGIDAIAGGNGNDTINGGSGTETLFGDAGNDLFILGDGEGNDNFNGGLDNDTVDLSALVPFNLDVDLAAGSWGVFGTAFGVMDGIENIISSVGNDTLRGNTEANNLSGGDGEDSIYGNAGTDILTGGAGGDNLYGGSGADQHIGGNDAAIDYARYDDANYGNLTIRLDNSNLNAGAAAVGDTYVGIEGVFGGIGNDTIVGNAAVNYLHGSDGNDSLNGLAGIDFLFGGSGDDSYVLGADLDIISDTSGLDTITSSITRDLTSYAAIENLKLIGTDNINGNGNLLVNRIIGNSGNNVLYGGADSLVDTLIGGDGDDTYVLGAGIDNIGDSAGIDTITSAITRDLTLFTAIENLRLVGTGNSNGTGNALINRIVGNANNNVLSGGADNLVDTLIGGDGDDTYVLGAGFDRVGDSAGIDTITTTISRNLTSYATIEYLRLIGTGNIDGTGNTLGNRITGNSGTNTIDGLLGNDVLTGGAGTDSFLFTTALSPANVDRITDYSVADDTIRIDNAVFTTLGLGNLAASAFASNTTGLAGDISDRIIYESDTGRLFYDADGLGGTATGIHFATISIGLALTQADFVVF